LDSSPLLVEKKRPVTGKPFTYKGISDPDYDNRLLNQARHSSSTFFKSAV